MKSCHFYRIAQCSSKNSMKLSSFSITFHDQGAPWSWSYCAFSHSRSLLHTLHEVRAATQHRYNNNTCLTAIFHDNLVFIGARTMEMVVTITAIRCSKLHSNYHHQQTNTQLLNRPDTLPVAQPIVSNHLTDNTRKVK